MKISYDQFLAEVKANDGEILPTLGGRKKFRVGWISDGAIFTPLSSKRPRKLSRAQIESYLQRFEETGSTITTAYSRDHRNQSHALAIIKLILGQSEPPDLVDDGTGDKIDPEFSAPEGEEKVRSHRHRERSRELVKLAKALFRQDHGRLYCEVCGFDFGKTFGAPDFIEAHHRIPLRDLKDGQKTKVSDLAMVCPNCHRMLHRGSPWPTIEELRRRRRDS